MKHVPETVHELIYNQVAKKVGTQRIRGDMYKAAGCEYSSAFAYKQLPVLGRLIVLWTSLDREDVNVVAVTLKGRLMLPGGAYA